MNHSTNWEPIRGVFNNSKGMGLQLATEFPQPLQKLSESAVVADQDTLPSWRLAWQWTGYQMYVYIYIYGYGSIPINTIFSGMNIHLPAILMFTRGTRFWHTAIYIYIYIYKELPINHQGLRMKLSTSEPLGAILVPGQLIVNVTSFSHL